MAKALKRLIAGELKGQLTGVDGFVLVDTTKLDAHHAEEIRSELRSKGLRMQVIKNSLARRVFEELGLPDLEDRLQGQTAILYGDEGTLEVTKTLVPWKTKNKLLPVRGGLLDGRILSPKEVDRLAAIPDRPVLRAGLLTLLGGPMRRFHAALDGPVRSFACLIAALVGKREGSA